MEPREPLKYGDPAQAGPYRLVGRLGASDLGQGYVGRHPGGATVTVTMLHPHLAADPRFRDRFRRDVAGARLVTVPFVLPVDADTDCSAPYLVTASPDVPSLAATVTGGGPLPPHLIREVAVALTGALVGAHEAGAVLTGLEPSAVLMTPEGPRLAPFGIVRAAQGPRPAAGGVRTDPDAVYTLGALLHFAATGRPPAAGNRQPGPPPAADPLLWQLITDCLAARPAARPTLPDLVARLNGSTPPGAVRPLPTPTRVPWWRDVPGAVVATAIGLAVIAALILSAGSSHDDTLAKLPPGATATAFPDLPSLPGTLPTDDGTDPDNGTDPDDGTNPGDGGGQPDDSQQPADPPAEDPIEDPIADAVTGDCFDNAGTAKEADLKPSACLPQTFKVVGVLHGTTDPGDCDNAPDVSWNVSYSGRNLVLCLSYQYDSGTAYHATAGECVYGTSGTSDWDRLKCQTGAFTVLKRYTGTTDGTRCKGLRNFDWAEQFGVSGRTDLGVTICLTMIYPDDAGHAVQNQCMRMSGKATQPLLHAVSCGSANVIVTGRTHVYNDRKFCGNDAWTTWKPSDFPSLSYTVCFRRR